MPDYVTLKLIWWLIVVVLLVGFAVMDGFDLGVAIVLPLVARTDDERRVAINVVGPTWEGNQVWLVLAGGAVFAAWPLVYAAGFSVFYLALILTLCALFLRPVGFDFRSKVADPRWRAFWDWGLFVGGLVPSLVFGVAIGNLFTGVPFRFDADLRITYAGGIVSELANPFALYCGVVSVAMLAMHGSSLLVLRTEGSVFARARQASQYLAIGVALLFALGGAWLLHQNGLILASGQALNGPLNPLDKHVALAEGGWLHNYAVWPLFWIAPALGIGAAILTGLAAWARWRWPTFLLSSVAVAAVLSTAAVSLFPFILPSSIDAASSLTAWDAVSSHKTLWVMLIVVILFLPIVLLYTSWVYRILRGRVTVERIRSETHTAY